MEKPQRHVYYPIYLDLKNRKAVIIGGGEKTVKKVLSLIETQSDIVVIAKNVVPALRALSDENQITIINRDYKNGDLKDAFIVIVMDTSDPSINHAVNEEATERNVVCNVEDVTNLCTFITPAIVRRGDVTVAISTSGTSPALARKFREVLSGTSRVINTHSIMEFADLTEILSDTRKELMNRKIKLNLDHYQACITDELIELVHVGKNDQAREVLMNNLLKGASCNCVPDFCQMLSEMS
jgi:precorrin-2 dehydrogenase/sirohydrochlorin ferrochelatase